MVRALLRTGFLLLLGGLLVLPATAGAHSGGLMGRVDGRLVEVHRDVIGGEPIPGFSLDGADTRRTLSPDQPRALVGQEVTVKDTSRLAGLQGEAAPTSGTRELLAGPPGPATTAVVLVNFAAPNNTTPVSPGAIKSTVFTGADSTSQFFQEQSDGAVSLTGIADPTGDVFGWWTLDMPKPSCGDADVVDQMYEIATRALAYDGTVGVNLDAYDHVSFYFPYNANCHWAGLGEVGKVPGRTWSYSWINGLDYSWLFAHEIGHNMGVHHAASLDCGASTITADPYSALPNPDSANPAAPHRTDGCDYSEYGDEYDAMGSRFMNVSGDFPNSPDLSGDGRALMSAWHRAQLGHLPAPDRETVTSSGAFTIDTVNNSAADDPRLLLVPRRVGSAPVTEYFAVELRSTFGTFDTFLPSSPQVTGVTIRLVPLLSVVNTSELLDTHPGNGAGFSDSGLQPGETFTDPLSDVQIRNDATAGGTASLTVTVPELDTTPPTAPVVSVVAGTAGPEVSWTAASDNAGIDHYEIRRNGLALATTPPSTLAYTDTDVSGMAQASYQVVAFDTSANSTASNTVVFSLPDVTPPVMAVASAERRSNGDVALTFSGTDDRGVDHYAVSWPGGGAIVTGSQWVHAGAPADATSYVVVAVDAAGNVSTAMTVSVGPATTNVAPEARPTALSPLPRLIVTRGRGGRVVITVSGATRISVTGLGWRASVSGQRLSRTLPARLRTARKAKLDVRAVVNGRTLRATLVLRRGVVGVR